MRALDNFIDATLSLHAERKLTSPYDADWRSPCELEQVGDLTYWRPIQQHPPVNFEGLAHALEVPIHPDICAYYGSWWSGTLEASSEEGPVSLIQLWNEEDFERLIANLIGHSLNQRRSRSPFSVFFATTDPDSEMFLTIHNETGVVLLEEPGKKPLREVESDIHSFLRRLKPEIRTPAIY
jgi:SecY interacting protein Syd